jgi:signal transduction histidine kinase
LLFAAPLLVGGEKYFLYLTLPKTVTERWSVFFSMTPMILGFSLMVIVALCVVSLFGAMLFRLITRRFHALVQVVDAFGRGELSRRAAVAGSDEIDELGRTFNAMAAQINDSMKTIADRDALRRELVANVSHDLSTPATVIKSYSELLLKGAGSDETARKEYSERIVRNASLLETLLEELTELSRLEAVELKPLLDEIAVNDLFRQVDTDCRLLADRKGVRFVTSLQDEPRLSVIADSIMLERILMNLLNNAIRHTPPGGTVELSAAALPSVVRFSVGDTGSGIRADLLPKIFERVVQGTGHAGKLQLAESQLAAVTARAGDEQAPRNHPDTAIDIPAGIFEARQPIAQRRSDIIQPHLHAREPE